MYSSRIKLEKIGLRHNEAVEHAIIVESMNGERSETRTQTRHRRVSPLMNHTILSDELEDD